MTVNIFGELIHRTLYKLEEDKKKNVQNTLSSLSYSTKITFNYMCSDIIPFLLSKKIITKTRNGRSMKIEITMKGSDIVKLLREVEKRMQL